MRELTCFEAKAVPDARVLLLEGLEARAAPGVAQREFTCVNEVREQQFAFLRLQR